jgi:AcrR family transcriptional regulator
VFAEAGYRAAKVSDVAARVGVTEPVIFQNFGSKAALFAAVVEYAAAEASTWLDGLDADHGPAAALLAHVLSGPTAPAGHPGLAEHLALAGPPAAAYSVLFADAAALTAEPELSEPARVAVRAVAGHLADLIRRGQAGGGAATPGAATPGTGVPETGAPGTDPEAAAWLLLSLLAARRLREAAMPPELEPALADLVLRALAPGNFHGHE